MTYSEYLAKIATLLRNAGVEVVPTARLGYFICTGKNGLSLEASFYVTPAGNHKIAYTAIGSTVESKAKNLSAFLCATELADWSYTVMDASAQQAANALPVEQLPQEVSFGKYKGKSYADVAASDAQYLRNFVLLKDFKPEVKRAARIALGMPDTPQYPDMPQYQVPDRMVRPPQDCSSYLMPIIEFDLLYYS
jgi:hypothetical protein